MFLSLTKQLFLRCQKVSHQSPGTRENSTKFEERLQIARFLIAPHFTQSPVACHPVLLSCWCGVRCAGVSHTQLAHMSFDKLLDLTAWRVFLIWAAAKNRYPKRVVYEALLGLKDGYTQTGDNGRPKV